MTEPSARLFFALWPDERMQIALASATGAITQSSDGRALPAQYLHLTLAFLGAVLESRVGALGAVANQVARDFPPQGEPIAFVLDRVEHWRRAQILCATASAVPPAAVALSEALKRALIGEGFAPDLKPFRAHATFARKVQRLTRELDMQPVSWSFRDFRLIESRTDPSGSIYSTREIWALDGSRR